MKDFHSLALRIAETSATTLLERQVLDRQSDNLGAISDPITGLCNPGDASRALRVWASVLLYRDSRYYLDTGVASRMQLALAFLERVQRHDGTFDLLVTNFLSAPDTGFIVHDLAYAYRLLTQSSDPITGTPLSQPSSLPSDRTTSDDTGEQPPSGLGSLVPRLRVLIEKAGYGMCEGGFHTPNHRWVLAAALMMAHNICGIDAFSDAAHCYLSEGIDCDCNGEFTERSAGIYNATNDHALIVLAEETGCRDLLEHVKRNLEMMFTYMDPDGSIFTGNSARQDRSGAVLHSPARYLPLYLYMAHKLNDGRFAAMADRIARVLSESPVPREDIDQAGFLHLLMLKPGLAKMPSSICAIPSTLEAFYRESGIVRIRRDNVSLSLLRDSSSFLFFQVGSLRCRVKACASFFAVAQFKAERLDKIHGAYIMESTARGSYRLPFEVPPDSPDWCSMDHSRRKVAKRLELTTRVIVSERNSCVSVRILTHGCDRVPIKVEFCFSAPVTLQGNGFCLHGRAGQSLVVRSGHVIVSNGTDSMQIGPGFAAHTYTETMRGSEPQSPHEFTVYFTDFTNIDREFKLIPVIASTGHAS